MVAPAPPVHLIIRLPYNRSEFPIPDPPLVQWNADKENMLWGVIARSRAADSGGTDWPALSAHLQVPLPYLLYRAQVRYEEDLRGLQDIRSTLGVSGSGAVRTDVTRADERVSSGIGTARGASRLASSSLKGRPPTSMHIRTSSQSTPVNKLLKDIDPSQRRNSTPSGAPRRVTTPPISEPSGSDEEIEKEEEEAKRQEEQEAVSRRLKELEKMMSSDLLGFASSPSRPRAGPSLNVVQSRSPLRETVRQGESTSTSESPVTSPQGSIPSIPSPPAESQSQTFSSQSSSQAATTLHPPVSPQSRGWRQLSPRRGLAVKAIHSHRGSSQGSAASSFSDLSDAPSVSASALESALMSNIRGAGSRLSLFARSHLGGRGGAGH